MLTWFKRRTVASVDLSHGPVCSCYVCRLDRAIDETQRVAGISVPVVPVSVKLLAEEVKASRDPVAFAGMLIDLSRARQ